MPSGSCSEPQVHYIQSDAIRPPLVQAKLTGMGVGMCGSVSGTVLRVAQMVPDRLAFFVPSVGLGPPHPTRAQPLQ